MQRKRMRTLILCGLLVLPAAAQEDSWKTEIDNSLVRVSRGFLEPRQAVSSAEMPPLLLVFFTDYAVRHTTSAGPVELRGKPGGFLWHAGGRIRLENLDDRRLEVARVAPKFDPEPSFRMPGNMRRVEFDNDLIRTRHIGPSSAAASKGGTRRWEHFAPSVLIELSAGHFKLTHEDGRVEEKRLKAGDIWFQAGDDGFHGEGFGDTLGHEAVRIEMKTSGRIF